MPTTYTLIASNTLSSSATSVTFSAIPATYTDLVLRLSARSNDGGISQGFLMQFNSDTATNYSYTDIRGNSSTVSSGRATSSTQIENIYTIPGGSVTSNTFSSIEIYLPNYLSTSSRPSSVFGVQENNSAIAFEANIVATAGLYRGSSAISSIKLAVYDFSGTLSFVSGSSFFLYGIKKS